MNLNKKITLYREQANMSKSELARLIGVSPSYITKLENGEKANPSLEIKIKIANALEIPPSLFLMMKALKNIWIRDSRKIELGNQKLLKKPLGMII